MTLDYGELRKEFAEHRGIQVSEKFKKELNSHEIVERIKEQNSKSNFDEEFNFDDVNINTMQKDRDDLTKFKQQFERENPDLAKTLSQETRTEQENRAMAVEKAFKQFEKRTERKPQDLAAKKR